MFHILKNISVCLCFTLFYIAQADINLTIPQSIQTLNPQATITNPVPTGSGLQEAPVKQNDQGSSDQSYDAKFQALTNQKNGALCSSNKQCASKKCADSYRCAPRDNSSEEGKYCHHDNHCSSRKCGCNKFSREKNSFCKNWRAGGSGVCLAKRNNGLDCTDNKNCKSDYCADNNRSISLDWWKWPTKGGRCAPKNNTGHDKSTGGNYCHHDNHCKSNNCKCPEGKSWGFCANWEKYYTDDSSGLANKLHLDYQLKRGNFRCLR